MNALTDFADFFSPILVKELRQGLRTRVFVSSFLLLQLTLVFSVVISVLTREAFGSSPDIGEGIFWGVTGICLLLVLPARGYAAITGEITAQTLELLYLSRLSVSRIVFGKWIAMSAQIALFVCSVLPYLLLRYFLGSVNVLLELTALGWMTLLSLLLSAVAVSSSCFHKSRVIRGLVPLFLFGLFQIGASSFYMPAFGRGGNSIALTLMAFAPLLLLLILQVGASKIAPKAESHAGLIRGAGLFSICLAALLVWWGDSRWLATGLAGIVLVTSVIGALCEAPPRLPGVFVPFLKGGFAGRLACWIFLPGWQSGFFYSLLGIVLFALLGVDRTGWAPGDHAMWILVIGTVFFPAAVTKLFFAKRKQTLAIYMGCVIFMVVLALMTLMLEGTRYENYKIPALLFPGSKLFMGLVHSARFQFDLTTCLVPALSVIALFIIAVREMARLNPLRLRAEALLESDAN